MGTCGCAVNACLPVHSCPPALWCLHPHALVTGRFGNTSGLTTANCTGPSLPVFPGREPGTGVSSPTSSWQCSWGLYGPGGYSPCIQCPQGRFGELLANLTNATCSGPCTSPPGLSCGPGAISPSFPQQPCPAGQYGLGGSSPCAPCPPGTFGRVDGAVNASCSGLCVAGRFSNVSGQTSGVCPGVCTAPAGSECPPGSTAANASVPCTPGR